MKIFISDSEHDTFKIGRWLSEKLNGNEVVAFYGNMGAGKTVFIRGMADFFNLERSVSSPTFSILNVYSSKDVAIYHFDAYRISTIFDLESTGFFDYLGKGIMLIEWYENIDSIIDSIISEKIKVCIKRGKDCNKREIKIEGRNID